LSWSAAPLLRRDDIHAVPAATAVILELDVLNCEAIRQDDSSGIISAVSVAANNDGGSALGHQHPQLNMWASNLVGVAEIHRRQT
jgi:hypothetical protein